MYDAEPEQLVSAKVDTKLNYSAEIQSFEVITVKFEGWGPFFTTPG